MKTLLLKFRFWSAAQRWLTKTSNFFLARAESCHDRATKANVDLLATRGRE